MVVLGLSKLLLRFLYEVPPIDLLTYGLMSLLLLIATAAASLIPTLRAANVEPMDALRHQ